ncbi:RsmB/NOP family class I SAM-dependent RNA methyltransferase [Paenalcaligenes niemegkensis]|uniref:RsmB/NOP family class I SAM-dependent RNA methyltransferase n=1 Tax=Paenalcaligenes niemegkensis TaxID=2895469 RepID=UPI001EE8AA40|nr:RsmB/NOP family class I SAM-dependent RNA methyltransferase [Paenalcaligenes niemegkensis]MCQ9616598.1 RsmB/NOP family class I SAM-dependent RNA methyltransferase [Paenalcaligenes niemegkensis]
MSQSRAPKISDRRRTSAAGRSPRSQERGAVPTHDTAIAYKGAPMAASARRVEQVSQALGEILQWKQPADATLSQWMRARKSMGGRDRSEVTDAVFDVLRHLRLYRHYAESGQGSASRRLAILGLSTVLSPDFLQSALDEQEQRWLAHTKNIPLEPLSEAVRYSLPDWLEAEFTQLESPWTLAEALNQNATLDLRANPYKIDRDELIEKLKAGPARRFKPVATPYSPWGIRVESRPYVAKWPEFEKGELEVQDEGSQLLAALMAPKRGEMIIDFCAGAGGKTLLLGAMMRSTGRLYAFDVSAARLARAKPRFARSGLSNIVPVVVDESSDQRIKRLQGKAHRVLVDAPCSGLGTLRRNPDLKWRQHPDALQQYIELQQRILQRASRCVAPGGRLVYATCSVLPKENEDQVQQFLTANPDFELLPVNEILAARVPTLSMTGPYLKLRPDMHGTDGFFAAVMQKKSLSS